MDLNLSDEQHLLRDAVQRFVAERYTVELRRRSADSALGFDRDVWQRFVELGWLALPIGEAYGGLGAGAVEIGILMEAFGRGLISEPFVSTVVLGAGLIERRGSEAQKLAFLPNVVEGSLLLAFAHSERAARFDLTDIRTTATRTDQGWRIDGSKIAVLDGHGADVIIVSAMIGDAGISQGRAGLFLVPADTRNLKINGYPRLGGGRAANINLLDVHVPSDALIGDEIDAMSDIAWCVDRAITALNAEAVGAMQTLVDMTVEYTSVRKQFGRPLSANQAIRHRLADMAVQCDEARSINLRAALKLHLDPAERGRAVSGAKAKIGRCARFVGEQAIQLHGGMGVTEELDVGAYFKRLVAFDTLFGGSAQHYRRHAELSRLAS